MKRVLNFLLALIALTIMCLLPTIGAVADIYDSTCIEGYDCALYDPNACGSTDASTGEAITGDIKSLAQQVLDDKNVSFDYGPSGEVAANFKLLADGQDAKTDDGRAVKVQPIVLVTILHLAKGHKVNVSSLTDGDSHVAPTNPHGSGNAVDINIFDGKHTDGSDATAQALINIAAEVLPSGSRFGMGNGPFGTKQINGKTFHSFTDNTNHLHIDVLGVSQQDKDAAVTQAGAAPTGSGSGGDGPVFILGDSITAASQEQYRAAFQNKDIPVEIDGSSSRSITSPGIDGNKLSGLDAIDHDRETIKSASAVVIALGTNGDTNKATIGKVVGAIKDINPSAQIFWVDTISVDRSDNFNETVIGPANTAIYGEQGDQGYRVISWFKAVSPGGDPKDPTKKESDPNNYIKAITDDSLGVHPTSEGSRALAQLVVTAVGGNVGPQSQSSCCSAGGTSNLSGNTTGEQAFSFLVNEKGLSQAGAAGMIGNMTTESVGVEPQRLQNHVTEKIPAQDIPEGEKGNGYGIVQWTPARDKILKAARPITKANDLSFQLNYLWKELTSGYSSVISRLKDIGSPEQASDIFLDGFEKPKDPEASRATRQAYARAYYNLVTKGTPLPKSVPVSEAAGSSGGGGSGGGCSDNSSDDGQCNVSAPVWGSINGSGSEYSQEQLKQLFGDPGTGSSHPEIDKNLVRVDFNGHSVQVNKKAAACLKAVAQEIEEKNISYTIKEMGCYRFDSDNGSSNIGLRSYHTYGVACDINWSTNPFVGNGASAPHDMPQSYIKAFHDRGFTWGGDWVSVKDYMHFEFNGIKP